MQTDKVYLVGFMGAGKSTIARALGRRLGWRVEDVDERVEARERRTVAAIFAQQGEAYFRQLERQVLAELVAQRHVIVATGGGTFAEADNRALMMSDGAVAWLDVPLAQVMKRVPNDGRRPLAADRAAMEQLYLRRQLAYAQAHVRIDSSRPAPEVVEELLEWIGLLMRYLVLSDVHANLEALTAVLEASAGAYDQVLVLGDLVGYGADPNAVVELVQTLPIAAKVRGNHDKGAAGLDSVDSFNNVARQAIEWTTRMLTPGNLRWLADLPQGPATIDDLTEICHGAPWDEDAYLFDERDVERVQAGPGRPLCLFGHTHVPSIFRVGTGVEAMLPVRGDRCRVTIEGDQRFLVNCGAVGQPRDGDPRAAFGLLDPATRSVTIARTPYDVAGAQARILAAGLPPVLAQRLALGR